MAGTRNLTIAIDILARGGNAATVLTALSGHILGLNKSTTELAGKFASLKKIIGGGAVAFGGGAIIASGLKLMQAGEGYVEQLNQAHVMGMSNLEIAKLEAAARETSAKTLAISLVESLRAGRELRSVFSNMDTVAKYLPTLMAMSSNIFVGSAAAGNPIDTGKATDMTYEAARALDLWNFTQNPVAAMRILNGMQKAATAYGYKVTPQDFYASAKYMKGVIPGEDFIARRLPVMISDLGASTAGVVVNQINRQLVAGRVDHKTAEALQRLGLVSPEGVILNKAGQIKGIKAGGVVGADLAAIDQYAWTQKFLVPAILKATGTSMASLQAGDPKTVAAFKMALSEAFGGNRSALQGFTMYATQQTKFERDAALMEKVLGITAQQIQNMKGSPTLARQGVATQWENVKTAIGAALAPAAIPLMIEFAKGLNAIAQAIQDHPMVTRILFGIAMGLGAIMVVVGGAVAIVGTFAALSALGVSAVAVGWVVAGIAAITGAIALLYAVPWGEVGKALKNWTIGFVNWIKNLPATLWARITGKPAAGSAPAHVPTQPKTAPPPNRASLPRSPANYHVTGQVDGRAVMKVAFDEYGRDLYNKMPTGSSSYDPRLAHPMLA